MDKAELETKDRAEAVEKVYSELGKAAEKLKGLTSHAAFEKKMNTPYVDLGQ